MRRVDAPRLALGGDAARARARLSRTAARGAARDRVVRRACSYKTPQHASNARTHARALLRTTDATKHCAQETSFEIVEKLTEMGVSATDVKKLKEAGFYTVQSLFMRPRKVRAAAASEPQQPLLR